MIRVQIQFNMESIIIRKLFNVVVSVRRIKPSVILKSAYNRSVYTIFATLLHSFVATTLSKFRPNIINVTRNRDLIH